MLDPLRGMATEENVALPVIETEIRDNVFARAQLPERPCHPLGSNEELATAARPQSDCPIIYRTT